MSAPHLISGRTWMFGDDINTDLMVPGPYLMAPEEEQKKAVFSANRPGWVDQVEQGDIIIGGRNFGVGSGRPAARSLRNLGVAALLAESINRLFLRGAVNFGFVALECPGICSAFTEGQVAEISLTDFTVHNPDSGVVRNIRPLPESLLEIMTTGGIFPSLVRRGLIKLGAGSIDDL